MAIRVQKKDFPYSHWEILEDNTGDRLRIVPERGGLITEWCCNGIEVLYFDLERFLKQDQSVRGGIPILFPICGQLRNDSLLLEQGNFILKQHGFARDSIWEIDFIPDRNLVILSMASNEITLSSYPYLFFIEIEVQLEKNSLNFKISVHNRSQSSMPFSFGLHPYFNVSDLMRLQVDGLQKKCINHITMREESTDQQLSSLLEGIDFLTGTSKSIFIIDSLAQRKIEIKHQQPMDLTVVWTDPPRSMICVEPWTSPRESLITGDRCLYIEPEEVQELKCQFMVHE